MSPQEADDFVIEWVPLSSLRPHPRNYRSHPEDQIAHLIASLNKHGWYKNIVIAADGTILGGHGMAEAARRRGDEMVPVRRKPYAPDSPDALAILAADNLLPYTADDDDRMLTDLLRELAESDTLLGTGFDEVQLAALVMITRPASEIADFDEAAEWVGLPEFETPTRGPVLILTFDTEERRAKFVADLGIKITKMLLTSWSAPYPPEGRADLTSIRFDPEDKVAS